MSQPDCAKSFLSVEWHDAYGWNVYDRHATGIQREYIDFTSGIFVANIGHDNAAVRDAMARIKFFHSYNYSTEIRTKYTDALCEKTGFECVALFSAGCEAVEAALRVMWAKQHRGMIYHTPGIFMHGKTYGARMIKHGCKSLEEGEMPKTFDPSIYLGEAFGYDTCFVAGVILESYRGWDAHFWDKQWIQDLRAYCTEHDILLCFDEIQSGFGRTGRFFCYEHYGVRPDLVCIGKAMGGGVPLSGLLGSSDLLNLPGDLSSTHSGNPLACAAGLAVLEEMERLDLVKEAERKGVILHERLSRLPVAVWGKGMVAALMFPGIEEADRVVTECYNKGLLVVHTGRESVKIGPPLTISEEALNKGIDIIEEVLG